MNAPLRGAEPDRQRYRGWIIDVEGNGFHVWREDSGVVGHVASMTSAMKLAELWSEFPTHTEPSEDDLEGPDEGPAVIYSAEELRSFDEVRERDDEFDERAW